LELAAANAFVAEHHRHHKPVTGHRFSIGALDSAGALVGVAIVGRPVARYCDQVFTVEVLRLCTNGAPNACSFLYAASQRAARALGYKKIQTYILSSELGSSLKASNWLREAETTGGTWNAGTRKGRRIDQPQEPKVRWAVLL
jgi:hypothetical protein